TGIERATRVDSGLQRIQGTRPYVPVDDAESPDNSLQTPAPGIVHGQVGPTDGGRLLLPAGGFGFAMSLLLGVALLVLAVAGATGLPRGFGLLAVAGLRLGTGLLLFRLRPLGLALGGPQHRATALRESAAAGKHFIDVVRIVILALDLIVVGQLGA